MEQVLPTDERDSYEACLVAVNTGITSLPCVITGKALRVDRLTCLKVFFRCFNVFYLPNLEQFLFLPGSLRPLLSFSVLLKLSLIVSFAIKAGFYDAKETTSFKNTKRQGFFFSFGDL